MIVIKFFIQYWSSEIIWEWARLYRFFKFFPSSSFKWPNWGHSNITRRSLNFRSPFFNWNGICTDFLLAINQRIQIPVKIFFSITKISQLNQQLSHFLMLFRIIRYRFKLFSNFPQFILKKLSNRQNKSFIMFRFKNLITAVIFTKKSKLRLPLQG